MFVLRVARKHAKVFTQCLNPFR